MMKRMALWLLLTKAPQLTILLIIILIDYGGIAFLIWVQCPVPMELSACLPASGSVVPILVATREYIIVLT